MADKIYDVIVVGSSPYLLVTAIIHSKLFNHSVLLLEQSSTFGGHWSPTEFCNYTIDNGPHLFYNFNTDMKYLFDILESICGLDFRVVKPSPRSDLLFFPHICELSFLPTKEYSLSYFLAIFRAFVLVPLLKIPHYAYYAPIGGTQSMISDLISSLTTHGGLAIANSKVISLRHCSHYSPGFSLVSVTTSTHSNYLARHVIASSSFCVNASTSTQGSTSSSTRLLHQLYVLVDSAVSSFSFFRCFRNTSFYLISDLSHTAVPSLQPNTLILSANLKNNVLPDHNHPYELISFLLSKRLIAHSSRRLKILEYSYNSIPSTRATSSDIQTVESLSPLLSIHHCQNLVRSLSSCLSSSNIS